MAEDTPPAQVENMLLLRKEDFDELLDRSAERGATVKVITTGVLAALVLGAAIKLKLMGGPQ